ncbi:hypothetical protein ACSBR1_004648 [Camellia fascicularis]
MASDEVPILDPIIGIGAALGANMEAEDAPALPPLVDRPFDATTYLSRTHAPPPGGILRFEGLIPGIDEDILLREPTEHLSADASMVIARRIGCYRSISSPWRWAYIDEGRVTVVRGPGREMVGHHRLIPLLIDRGADSDPLRLCDAHRLAGWSWRPDPM